MLQYIIGVLNLDFFCARERKQVEFLGGELACCDEGKYCVASNF